LVGAEQRHLLGNGVDPNFAGRGVNLLLVGALATSMGAAVVSL